MSNEHAFTCIQSLPKSVAQTPPRLFYFICPCVHVFPSLGRWCSSSVATESRFFLSLSRRRSSADWTCERIFLASRSCTLSDSLRAAVGVALSSTTSQPREIEGKATLLRTPSFSLMRQSSCLDDDVPPSEWVSLPFFTAFRSRPFALKKNEYYQVRRREERDQSCVRIARCFFGVADYVR